MPSVFDIKILWDVFKYVKDALREKTDKQNANLIAAHKAMHTAFIKTYDYLRNKQGAYLPNIELAEAWNNASAAVMAVDRGMGDMLHGKSRFWTDPQLFMNLNRDDEVVSLERIVDEMEHLRMKLK